MMWGPLPSPVVVRELAGYDVHRERPSGWRADRWLPVATPLPAVVVLGLGGRGGRVHPGL